MKAFASTIRQVPMGAVVPLGVEVIASLIIGGWAIINGMDRDFLILGMICLNFGIPMFTGMYIQFHLDDIVRANCCYYLAVFTLVLSIIGAMVGATIIQVAVIILSAALAGMIAWSFFPKRR